MLTSQESLIKLKVNDAFTEEKEWLELLHFYKRMSAGEITISCATIECKNSGGDDTNLIEMSIAMKEYKELLSNPPTMETESETEYGLTGPGTWNNKPAQIHVVKHSNLAHVDPKLVDDARRELAPSLQLHHQIQMENLLPVFGCTVRSADNSIWIAMKSSGDSLQQDGESELPIKLEKLRKCNAPAIKGLCKQLLKGIAYIHYSQPNAIHGLLIPSRIEISDTDGEWLLQIAGWTQNNIILEILRPAVDPDMLCWLAPECQMAEFHRHQSQDIWSAGCLIYLVFVGGNPFAECESASARWRAGTDQESIEQTLKNIEVLDSEAKQTREKIKKAMQKHADVAHLVQLLLFERPIAEKALRHPVFWPATHTTDLCYLLRESLENLKPLKKAVCDSMKSFGVADSWVDTVATNAPEFGQWEFVTNNQFHHLTKPGNEWGLIVFIRNQVCHPC